MMLDIAETLDPLLDTRIRRIEEDELDPDEDEEAAETTLQLIFFDGEEAFVQWTDTDSIYGARSISSSPSFLLPTHSRIPRSQPPRRNLGSGIPPPAPQTSPTLFLDAGHAALHLRAPRPARPPRRRTPARALILSRHCLAFRLARRRGDASAQSGDPRCRNTRRELLPQAPRDGPQPRLHGRRPHPVHTPWRERAARHRGAVPARVAYPRCAYISPFTSDVVGLDFHDRTMRRRLIFRPCVHGTSSSAYSSRSTLGCVPSLPNATSRRRRGSTPRR